MKVSVAIATFRGSQFITEQLASIVEQTLPPDEVVVFDDASDDDTVEVAKSFARSCSAPISVHRQASNVRVIENFASAISATHGDVIFLADQDDVWYPQKISKVVEAFDRDPAIGLVFSDADLVGANLMPLGRTLWQSIRFSKVERDLMRSTHAFDLLLKRFLVTGATLAFRRSLLDIVLPLSKYLIHDAWIALAIAAVSGVECLDEPLIQYRQHAGQQIGERSSWRSWRTQMQAAKKMSTGYFDKQRMFFHDLVNRLEENRTDWVHSNVGELAKQKLSHIDRRISFREHGVRSLPGIANEFASGGYSRYSYGWKSAAQDLFL